jgi:hypothetical protein
MGHLGGLNYHENAIGFPNSVHVWARVCVVAFWDCCRRGPQTRGRLEATGWGRIPPCVVRLLVAAGVPGFVVAPTSASVFTGPSPQCVHVLLCLLRTLVMLHEGPFCSSVATYQSICTHGNQFPKSHAEVLGLGLQSVFLGNKIQPTAGRHRPLSTQILILLFLSGAWLGDY